MRNESKETVVGDKKMKEKATSMIEGGAMVFLLWEKRSVKREKRSVEREKCSKKNRVGLDYIV